jgi:hypothetical protein
MYIVTMHIRGTLYALLTRYIQCTLDVVINALNSFQIDVHNPYSTGESECDSLAFEQSKSFAPCTTP